MNRLAVIALAVLVVGIPAVGGLQTQEVGPPLDLDPRQAHIDLYLRGAPNLKFYARKDLSGAPAIELNERGAFVRSTLVCSWPDGRYDQQNEGNMVLGYATGPEVGTPRYTPCPDGFPVISTWGDRGLGAATLLIEVFSRTGTLVEVRFRGQSLYFDLNALPGDPRDVAQVPSSIFVTGPPASSFGVKMKGFLGWEWEISAVDAARLKAVAATRLRRQPAFARFLRDVQQCVASPQNAPQCLIPHVQESMLNIDRDKVIAAAFVDDVWQRVDTEGRRLWTYLAGCFSSNDLDASDTAARFEASEGYICDVELTKMGWKLTGFIQTD